jgi:hypothetical protein
MYFPHLEAIIYVQIKLNDLFIDMVKTHESSKIFKGPIFPIS